MIVRPGERSLESPGVPTAVAGRKTFTVQEVGELIAKVNRGAVIVLTDGDQQVTLHPGRTLDLESDSPELAAELLKAVERPHAPLFPDELSGIAHQAVQEHRARRAS